LDGGPGAIVRVIHRSRVLKYGVFSIIAGKSAGSCPVEYF
jgi:hypothetical protein